MAREKRIAPPPDVDAGRPILYSKTCQYALRTMERVATHEMLDPETWIPQQILAAELEISSPTLAQIIHRLRKANLLTARRGPSGGVGLPRAAKKITVLEIARAIDGSGLSGRCLLGFPACNDDQPCPAHPVWTKVRPLLEKELEQKTLADLVDSVVEAEKRIRRRAGRSKPKPKRSSR